MPACAFCCLVFWRFRKSGGPGEAVLRFARPSPVRWHADLWPLPATFCRDESSNHQFAVIVTMGPVWMVQVALHQIVHMVAVRDGFMPTVRAVDVVGLMRSAVVVGCTTILVGFAGFQFVFVHMVSVKVVQMAVVQIIGVSIVLDSRVTTIGTVDMGMPFMSYAGFRHDDSPLADGF